MTTEVVTTGAVFDLIDKFSPNLEKLVAGLGKAEASSKQLQVQLDKLGLGAAVAKMRGEWTEIGALADKGVAGIIGKFDTLGRDIMPGLASMNVSVDRAMGAIVASGDAVGGKVVAGFNKMGGEASKALAVSLEASAPTAFKPLVDAAAAASGEMVTALGSLDGAIAGPLASMRALVGEMTTAAGLMERVSAGSAAAGAVGRTPNAHLGDRGHRGGPHFGRVGAEIPGGHASIGGGPGLAAAGILGFGVYEAAQMRDEIQRLMITGQVDPEKFGQTRDQFSKLMQDAASTTGFSVKEVGEALAKSERALAGVDVATKMDVTQALIPYAATEARLKGTGLAEALETMVGLSHMTGTFDVEGVKDLARKFSFVSLATNASLPSFEKTLSYSMPILRTGMGMSPDTIMALTAASQNAGITSTKSGTWLRSFFQGSEPEVGDGDHAEKHNEALRKMGLLDSRNRPTWKVYGDDGKVDWNASVVKEGGIIHDHLAQVPVDERMSTVSKIWGERGGAMASMLSMNTFMEQFSIIAQKIQNFQGGASAIEEYTKDNPAQKARETWRDFENVLMNIGDKALPTVNAALTSLDEALKRLPADWEATKAMWGFHKDQVLDAPKSAADALGKAIPGPLGAPFRDKSKPAFDPNAVPTFGGGFNPTAYTDSDVIGPSGGGTGPGSSTYMLAMGVYGGLKSFAADTGGRIPVSLDGAIAGLADVGGGAWMGAGGGGAGHGNSPSIRYGRQHSFGGGGPVAPFHLEGSQAKQLGDSIRLAAQHLGIEAKDLATTISYETAGTMDPWKAGPHTKWGWHHGLIQWGEPQAHQYGVGPNSTIGQQMAAVEHYLRDAGVRPGMGIKDVYSAINAGHVGKYGASDGYGTVATHVDKMLGSAHRTALDRLDVAGAGAASSPALRAAVTGFVLPKGGYWAKDGQGNPVPVGPDGAAIQSYRPTPTVDGRRTVSPGKAAAGGQQALNVTLHSHTHLDGKQIAKSTTKHSVDMLAQAMAHPTTNGGPDGRTHYAHSGVPFTDAA
jgi:hypothetical protein